MAPCQQHVGIAYSQINLKTSEFLTNDHHIFGAVVLVLLAS